MNRFSRYVLRTVNADAARAFYAAVLGHDGADVVPLHEQALARGARPHWLGMIEVANVEAIAASLVEQGGTRLGPPAPMGDGLFATMRDGGGALVGLTSDTTGAKPRIEIAWHGLNTSDLLRALHSYAAIFGWRMTSVIDLGADGIHHQFAWGPKLPSVGSIAGIAGRSGVHPHWLFQIRVANLDGAIAAVRDGGGAVVSVVRSPDGGRVAVCDDPQGAAFAMKDLVG